MISKRMKGGNGVSVSGAEPHGRVDKVLSPKKPVLAQPNSNQEPTLSAELRIRRQANLTTSTTFYGSTIGELRNSAPGSRFVTVFHLPTA